MSRCLLRVLLTCMHREQLETFRVKSDELPTLLAVLDFVPLNARVVTRLVHTGYSMLGWDKP